MRELEYCIQCKDKKTGRIGDFMHNGDFTAISPVFDNLIDFFNWCDENNYVPNTWDLSVNRKEN